MKKILIFKLGLSNKCAEQTWDYQNNTWWENQFF